MLFRWQLIRLGAPSEECAVEVRVVELRFVELRVVGLRIEIRNLRVESLVVGRYAIEGTKSLSGR